MEHAAADQNPWVSVSELAVAGRAVAVNEQDKGAPTVRLPKGQELLIPEPATPDSNLKIADRLRPSPEQAAAQKGVSRCEVLLRSLFRNMKLKGPVLLVNLTGYVEEFGSAASWLIIPAPSDYCFFFSLRDYHLLGSSSAKTVGPRQRLFHVSTVVRKQKK